MKKNKLIEQTLKQMLNYHLLDRCMNCGLHRTRVPFNELPEEIKRLVKESKDQAYILHCKNCNEYSLVFELE